VLAIAGRSAVRFTTGSTTRRSRQVIQGNGVTPNIRVGHDRRTGARSDGLRNAGNFKPDDEINIQDTRIPHMVRAIDALKGVDDLRKQARRRRSVKKSQFPVIPAESRIAADCHSDLQRMSRLR